jgi:hypothetical protein
MSGRTALAETLTAGLPNWLILSDARQLDRVPKPGACVLWTAKRHRLELNGFNYTRDEVELWVLTATDKPADIEDDLDQQFEQVVQVIEAAPAFAWTEAARGVLADKFHGWQITVICAARIDHTPDPEEPTQEN